MRRTFIILLCLALPALAIGQNGGSQPRKGIGEAKKVDSGKLCIRTNESRIEFQDPQHDFGMIYRGDTVYHNFHFTNTGTDNLLIESVITSCGCTASQYTNTPVKPGESGVIIIEYKTAGKIGKQHNTVTVKSTASNGPRELHISAMVVKKDRQDLQTK